jgi:hypothetical protein
MSVYDQIEEARLAHMRRQYQDNHREYQRLAPAPRATRRLLGRCAVLLVLGALGFYVVSEIYESGTRGGLSSRSSEAASSQRDATDNEAAAIDSVMKDPGRYIKPE